VSGPVSTIDAPPAVAEGSHPSAACVEVTESREAQVGKLRVRRALSRRGRRMVGAWCFADHMGPADVTEDSGLDVGPHPHIGLQTVTWLIDGQALHRDSLGSEQVIQPGQLNLMTSGNAVSHAEEATGHYRGTLEGIQLWVALPEDTRHGPAAFEHHAELPQCELDGATATLLIGDFAELTSPARHDTPLELTTEIWPVPVELPDAIPFPDDDTHDDYDAAAVTTFWRILVETERVLDLFRARFVGKSSPVHLFWGGLDLATTRFSGDEAPPHPGGMPNCGPHVIQEAYSHEVSSAGYWPGGEGEGIFYSYAYPEPDDYRTMPAGPAAARFDDVLGEFVLPYTAVRTAPDQDAVLLDFLQHSYEAAATAGNWDRAALERTGGLP
jgi:Family of unknown function (DUF5996)/Pirin